MWNTKFSIQKKKYTILNYRWVDGESFPGQNKGYSHPTEVQMTENVSGSEAGNKDEDSSSKTKTTFFYSDPSRLPSSHPYPSSALPDHHLVCSVSLLSFASYSPRSRNDLRIKKYYIFNVLISELYVVSLIQPSSCSCLPNIGKEGQGAEEADSLPAVVSNFILQ